ncbi:MAG: succinyl-diaminopimelate desuccinylase [Acidimicrobiia bacterium]
MTHLDTLIELVDIASVTGDEDAICTTLEARFKESFPTTRVKNSLVVGTRPPSGEFYALYGHIDTVPVQGDPSPRVLGDRLVGLGSSDMKAGVAIMVDLLEDPDIDVDHVVCVFYAAEEGPAAQNELQDVLAACPWLTGADLSIVLEPTDLKLEIGCNGVLNADVVFRGKSAHSARPWRGENAVTKAGAWLKKLHDLDPELVEIDGLQYREVFSVTKATGGIANNIIPPEFTINLNHRFPPIHTVAEAEQRLRDIAAEADDVVIKDSAPAGRVTPDDAATKRLDSLIAGERTAKQGWTDVARLTERGAVAVNYGPGEVAQAHQVDESVPIANLDIAYGVLQSFLSGHL